MSHMKNIVTVVVDKYIQAQMTVILNTGIKYFH